MRLKPIFIFVIICSFTFFSIGWANAQNYKYKSFFDYDANIKRVEYGDIVIQAPININCKWENPNDDWKLCEAVFAVSNKNIKHDFIEKNAPMSKFKHSIKDIKVYTSPLDHTYQETILNSTCIEENIKLKDAFTIDKEENNDKYYATCGYNVTRYVFKDWKLKTKLDKFPKNNIIGVKLVFKTPISVDAGVYLKNQFNFTISGFDYDITLDPDISACAVLSSSGSTYTLTADIIDETVGPCMNITGNNIILDCQNHKIDGDDLADDGILIYRNSPTNTNVTVKNCIVSDWDEDNIYLNYANNNTFNNITSKSSPDYGIYLGHSDSNTFYNVTSNDNNIGLRLYYSDFVNITKSAFKNNTGNYDVHHNTNCGDNDCHNVFDDVNGTSDKPILYFNDSISLDSWNNNASQILLCGADNSNITNLNMSGSGTEFAIDIAATNNTNIKNSQIDSMQIGIFMSESFNNNISNITGNSNDYSGIFLYNANNNVLNDVSVSNTALGTSYGITVYYSDYNSLYNITSNSNNDEGVRLEHSNYNILYNITANSNNDVGIFVGFSSSYNNLTYINVKDIQTNYGVRFYSSSNNNRLCNASLNDNTDTGLRLDTSSNNYIYNMTALRNDYGVFINSANSNTITYSNISYNNKTGIVMYSSGGTSPNNIYNNYICNNTDSDFGGDYNIGFGGTRYKNYWNTTEQDGDRIYTQGNKIGGNYWISVDGGFSDTCEDTDNDGFCDRVYDVYNETYCTVGVNCSDNIDQLMLSDEYIPTNKPPQYTSSGTNETDAGNISLFYEKWYDWEGNLSHYIFSTNNTGTWINDSTTVFSAINNSWSNVTKTLNDTLGLIIGWKVYANDTDNNWNVSEHSLIITGDYSRDTSQIINTNSDIEGPVGIFRYNTGIFGINNVISKLRNVLIDVSQDIRMNNIIDRIVAFSRALLQDIRYGNIFNRVYGVFRSRTLIINIGNNIGRVIEFSRGINRQINIGNSIDRAVTFRRGVKQQININNILNKFYGTFGTLYQTINVNNVLERLRNIPVGINQQINVGSITTRLVAFSRTLNQAIDINNIVDRFIGFFRSITQIFNIFNYVERGKATSYASSQYYIPNITAPSTSYDVKFKKVVLIDTDGDTVTFTRTLPSGADTWTVYESNNLCSGTELASGSGVTVTWDSASPVGDIENNTICYTYDSAISASSITFNQDTSVVSNDTRQYISGDTTFSENVGESFLSYWDMTNFMCAGATCYANCSNNTGYPSDGGFVLNVDGYGSYITQTEGDRIKIGDAEINQNTSYKKDVQYTNSFDENLTINTSISVPSCYVVPSVNITNSSGLGETIWTDATSIGANITVPTTGDVWTAYFNGPNLTITKNETSVDGNWYRNIWINGSCISVSNVKAWASIPEDRTSFALYDNTTGAMTDVTAESEYEVSFYDNDEDGYTDTINWTIPTLTANVVNKYVIEGKGVTCSLSSKEILNSPLRMMENIQWKEVISCSNTANTTVSYSQKWRMLFGSRDVKLEDTPKELTYDSRGAYIMLTGTLAGGTSETRNLTYITDAVTAEVTYTYPEDRGEKWVVDKESDIQIDVNVKNWAEADLDKTVEKEVPIYTGSGNNLVVYYNDSKIDSESTVLGKYTLSVNDLEAGESREYNINYTVVPAVSERLAKRMSELGLTVDLYRITGTISYSIPTLWFNPSDISYNKTQKVLNHFTDSPFEFEREFGDVLSVNLGSFPPAGEVTVAIYYGPSGETPTSEVVEKLKEFLFTREWTIPFYTSITGRYMKTWEVGTIFMSGFFTMFLIYKVLVRKGIIKKIKLPRILRRKKKKKPEVFFVEESI